MWAGLVGVLVGGVISVVVQWVVTPRVEARLRSEERWEAAVVDLHQLLTETTPRLVQRLDLAWQVLSQATEVAAERGLDLEVEPYRAHFLDLQQELRVASDEWGLHRERVNLLIHRVGISGHPGARMWPIYASMWPLRLVPGVVGNDAPAVTKALEDERSNRKRMLGVVEASLKELDERRSASFRLRLPKIGKPAAS